MKKNIFISLSFIVSCFFFALCSAMEEEQWHISSISSSSKEPKNFLLSTLDAIAENNDNFLALYAPKTNNLQEYQQITENFQKYTEQIKKRKENLEKDEDYNLFTLKMLTQVSFLVLEEYQKLTSDNDNNYYTHIIYHRNLQDLAHKGACY